MDTCSKGDHLLLAGLDWLGSKRPRSKFGSESSMTGVHPKRGFFSPPLKRHPRLQKSIQQSLNLGIAAEPPFLASPGVSQRGASLVNGRRSLCCPP